MKIRVTCPKCKVPTIVDDSELAEGDSGVCQIDCPKCQNPIKFRSSSKPVHTEGVAAKGVSAKQPTVDQAQASPSKPKPSTMEWSCGGCNAKLRVSTEAIGKSVRCPNCQEVGKVTSSEARPVTPSAPARKPQPRSVQPTSIPETTKATSSDDDWFSQLPSPLDQQPSAPSSYSNPYTASQPSPPSKQGFWGRLKEQHQRSKTQFGWREPTFYAVALRGDAAIRAAICAGLAFCVIGVFFAMTATNPNHPNFIPWAPISILFLSLGIFLFHVMCDGSGVAGRVSVNDYQIQLNVINPSFDYVVMKKFTWRFDQLSTVQLVSSSTLGTSYSILVMPGPKERHIVCVPRRIDLGSLIRFMNERGVNVVELSRLPESACKPVNSSFASIAIAVTLCLGTVGFGYYGMNYVPQGPPVRKQVAGPDIQADRDNGFIPFNWNRPKKKSKLDEDTERFRARVREEGREEMEAQERAIRGASTFPPVDSRFPPNMTPPVNQGIPSSMPPPPSQGFPSFNAPAGNPRNR